MVVFQHQTLIDLVVETGFTLSGSEKRLSIIYNKPSGTFGEWVAIKDGVSNLRYSIPASGYNVLDEAGTWKLQAKVVNAAGRTAYGEVEKMQVLKSLHKP